MTDEREETLLDEGTIFERKRIKNGRLFRSSTGKLVKEVETKELTIKDEATGEFQKHTQILVVDYIDELNNDELNNIASKISNKISKELLKSPIDWYKSPLNFPVKELKELFAFGTMMTKIEKDGSIRYITAEDIYAKEEETRDE